MADSLIASLGLYGAAFVGAFVSGLFPIVSIELLLAGLVVLGAGPGPMVVAIALAAVGHQLAKTITYYAGDGVFELPRGRAREKIAAARAWLERWSGRPRLILLVAATVGLPPMYVLGFVASPMLRIRIATFTALTFGGRAARYAAVVSVAFAARG